MNLEGLYSRTKVTFNNELSQDQLNLNGEPSSGEPLIRVSHFLDKVRQIAGIQHFAAVESTNNFPMGTGIASSASAFAALSLAASIAAGLELNEPELSRLARLGSGSACRSVPGGFVEWQAGESDIDSFAVPIAPSDYWDLVDCIAIISQEHKPTGSREGHTLAATSLFQAARVADAPYRLDLCRKSILARDFEALAEIVESDSNLMHAVMMTSNPPLVYWRTETISVIKAVRNWRTKECIPALYTVDAGPNVHVICPSSFLDQITSKLTGITGVQQVITAGVGGSARLEYR